MALLRNGVVRKVIKYLQSCLLLEKDGKRIVIDPGSFFVAKYGREELGSLEAALYIHQHADHFDAELAKVFIGEELPVYGNESVCVLILEGCEVADKVAFAVGGFEILPIELKHCVMADGSDGPQNTGYVIDGTFFHPGDGFEVEGLRGDNMALPIAGPSISFRTAVKFAESVGAKRVVPIHFDNVDMFPGNPNGFAQVFKVSEEIVLANGQSLEL